MDLISFFFSLHLVVATVALKPEQSRYANRVQDPGSFWYLCTVGSDAEVLMIMHRVSTDPHGSLLELHHGECPLAEIAFPDHTVFFHVFHTYAEVVTVQ